MYIVVNGFSVTGYDLTRPYVPYDSIQTSQSINDPQPQCQFDIIDETLVGTFAVGNEVIIFDENAPPTLTVSGRVIPATPAHNFCQDPDVMTSTTLWPASGSLSGLVSRSGASISITFNNSTNNATAQLTQQTLLGYVKPGQSYMFSMYLTIGTALVGSNAFIQMDFLDAASSVIGGSTQSFSTSSSTGGVASQKFISGVAPANAVFAKISFGGKTTSATNSGTLQWGNAYLEPMWFTAEGVTYPTPDNNFFQVASAIMPDFTLSRMCRVFAGFINDLEVTYEGRTRKYHVSCGGPGDVLEHSNVARPAYNDTDTNIISDVVGTTFSGLISTSKANSSSPNPLVTGVTLQAQFTDVSFRSILNSLIDESGYQYRFDWYYILHYNPLFYDIAGFSLSDTPDNVSSFAFYDYKNNSDGTQLKCQIKVVGSSSSNVSQIYGQNPATNNAPAYVTPSYGAIVTDTSLTSTGTTTGRGLSELTKYGTPRSVIQLKSAQYTMAGTAIYLTYSLDNINNVPFVVQKVTGRCKGAGINEYEYELGAYNPSVVDHVRNIVKKLSANTQTTTTTPAALDIALTETIVYSEQPITFTP